MRLVGAAVAIGLLLGACQGGEPSGSGPAGAVGPAVPGSVVLRELPSTTGQTYDPPTGQNSCSTRMTAYGSGRTPEEVRAFFADAGFRPRGDGGRFDRGFRWVAVREGDQGSWRKVDVADGATAGRPDQETYYEVFAPACGS